MKLRYSKIKRLLLKMQNINRIKTEFELWILTLSSRSSTLTCHLYFLPQDGSTHTGLNTEAAVNQKNKRCRLWFQSKMEHVPHTFKDLQVFLQRVIQESLFLFVFNQMYPRKIMSTLYSLWPF